MQYRSVNPFTGQTMASFDFGGLPSMDEKAAAFHGWRKTPLPQRLKCFETAITVLQKNRAQYAALITAEMGKPLREAEYEIDKSVTVLDYCLQHAAHWLQPESVSTGHSKSYVRFDPLGILFCIMPWNFPFWQVLRFAVPALAAGNTVILKHAPNVPQCARALEQLFAEAGFPKDVFTNLFLSNDDAAALIADPHIAGLSFTGSYRTGSHLAALAGRHLKKVVMELGGNDAFIVLPDADLDRAVQTAVKSRSINSGQACNGAKRFIVHADVLKLFSQKLIEAVLALKTGDPMRSETQIGPLARPDLAEKVRSQIAETVRQGATLRQASLPAGLNGNFVPPAVLERVAPGMCAFEEEIFGPVFSIIGAADVAHAITLANQSRYGLAASVWTADPSRAATFIEELETGNVFVNEMVKSDARLPFGGVKCSGFGRELSAFGLREFVNIKTVVIH